MFVPSVLELKSSPIHGLGLFAKEDIPKGTLLGLFEGEEMHISDFKQQYGKDYRYCYKLLRQQKIIVAKENRNWITFLNEYRTNPNVYLKRGQCWTHYDIKKGEELFLNYGSLYPRDW